MHFMLERLHYSFKSEFDPNEESMKLLAIDTSNTICSVTLMFDGEVVGEMQTSQPSKQAEQVFLLIKTLFDEHQCSYVDLDALAVTIGPGSFTGVRIGISAVKGLGLVTKLPIIPITTLECESMRVEERDKPILAVQDARRGQLYVQLFPSGEPGLVYVQDITRYIPDTDFYLVGSGIEKIHTILSKDRNLVVQTDHLVSTLAAKAATRYGIVEGVEISPLYIRKPDAIPQYF